VQCSADGERVLFGIHGFLGAFNVDHSEILEKWSIKKVAGGYLSAKLHPTIDLVWAGERVLQFSSGKEISVINRSSIGQVRSYSPVWVGTNRIVEIILPISTAVDSNTSSESTSTLALWDTESGELLVTKDAHRAVALCASPDGMSIAEGGNDRRVRIRNGKTLEIEREFRVHEDAVVAIAWHPTKSLLVTASKDTMIRIWDLKNLKTIEEFSAQAVNGSSLSITLDGFELSVPTTDGSIKVYRPKSFTE
jgi:WD40 repeat protein